MDILRRPFGGRGMGWRLCESVFVGSSSLLDSVGVLQRREPSLAG